MFLLVCIEQNRNYAKARIVPRVILVRNQALAGWEEKPAANFPALRSRQESTERKNDPLPVFVAWAPDAGAMEMAVLTTSKPILAAAALAAAMGLNMGLNMPAGHAAAWRENPWCAVIDYGDGGVTWECNYRTFEECYPNVLAGNKGSCNLNPAGPGPQAATPAAYHPRKKHHAQR